MRNFGYYVRETFGLFSGKSFLSIISTTMLLLLSISLSCSFFIGMYYSEILASEAEIAVFYSTPEKLDVIEKDIQAVSGVLGVRRITAEEAKAEMKTYLGEDADMLDKMKDNPFLPYLRVKVDATITVESIDTIKKIPLVTHVRDNRDILFKINHITQMIAIIGGAFVIVSVLTSAFISYYVSSENISMRRSQVENMKHMGAPDGFIMRPFRWHSVLLNLISSAIACGALYYLVYRFSSDYSIDLMQVSYFVYIASGFAVLTILIGVLGTVFSGRKYT